MACKLLVMSKKEVEMLGTFFNRKKAEAFWRTIRPNLEEKMGKYIIPIYVETRRNK